METLIVIDNDGFNVGYASCFGDMWLEFDEADVFDIANHWNCWALFPTPDTDKAAHE